MTYLSAIMSGGLLCAVGQILIDRTQLTPARILTGYVEAGVLLQAVGLYQPLVDWGGAGATVPLTGFGYCLAKGVAKAVAEKGLLGALTGGLTATAGGIAAAVVFGVLAALLFRPGDKRYAAHQEDGTKKAPGRGLFAVYMLLFIRRWRRRRRLPAGSGHP